MTDLVVHVPSVGNRFSDAFAQQGLKPASQPMHRCFDRPLDVSRRAATAAYPPTGVWPSRQAFSSSNSEARPSRSRRPPARDSTALFRTARRRIVTRCGLRRRVPGEFDVLLRADVKSARAVRRHGEGRATRQALSLTGQAHACAAQGAWLSSLSPSPACVRDYRPQVANPNRNAPLLRG